MGNMMDTLPSTLAFRIARSWVRNTSRFFRQYRMARRPNAGLPSAATWERINLSAPTSKVRMTSFLGATKAAKSI